jgi:hypothetical protein
MQPVRLNADGAATASGFNRVVYVARALDSAKIFGFTIPANATCHGR